MELKAFCDLCVAQVLEGKRNEGFLRKEGADAVIKQLSEIGKWCLTCSLKTNGI